MSQDLQYRLYNTTLTPPGDAWPNIVQSLDKETEEKLSGRLHLAAITPPANAWENIITALDAPAVVQEAKVISLTRRRNWLAAAAIAAGIIVLAGLYYFVINDASDNQASVPVNPQPATSPAKDSEPAPVTAKTATAVTPSEQLPVRNVTALGLSGGGYRAPRVRYARVKSNARKENVQYAMNTNDLADQQVSVQPKAYIKPQAYLTVEAPNGQPARISAKFADAVGYMMNNEPAESMSAALKSISWKRRISNWSNKLMMSPAFIPAATNFLDIVELEELLKD